MLDNITVEMTKIHLLNLNENLPTTILKIGFTTLHKKKIMKTFHEFKSNIKTFTIKKL